MIRLQAIALAPPELPRRGWTATTSQLAASLALHAAAIASLVLLMARPPARTAADVAAPRLVLPDQTARMIFIARAAETVSGGGGGGGNRQPGPIRRAEGIGRDRLTIPARRTPPPTLVVDRPDAPVLDSPPPGVLVDAKPLASGTRELIGLIDGGVPDSASLGPGSGGGAGTGKGTGIGPGNGPGVGDGDGGGIGGGVYRIGGSVSAPRVLVQVRPTYTEEALLRKVQGTVELELIVTKDGRPAGIRVRRSLDPGGLDERAIAAVDGWRFEPGRLAGRPVDVMVTVFLDFTIR